MSYYKELIFPVIPLNLLKSSNIFKRSKGFINQTDLIENSSEYTMYHITTELRNWLVVNNIIKLENINKVYIQTQSPGVHVVHTDFNRKYALNYIIDTGGDNVITSWYKQKGHPIVRKEKKERYQTDSESINYRDLEKLDHVKFEQNRWYLMKVNVLHDVQNITSLRKSLTIIVSDTELNMLNNNS